MKHQRLLWGGKPRMEAVMVAEPRQRFVARVTGALGALIGQSAH